MAFDVNDFLNKQANALGGSTSGSFDINDFVKNQIQATKDTGGFDVGSFLLSQGIQPTADPNSIEGLNQIAQNTGNSTVSSQASDIVNPPPKLSFLQRLGAGLGAFNPAQAVSVGMDKGLGAGLLEYPKSIARGLGSAITGNNYQPQRAAFADVVGKLGVENSIAKFGLGLVGDILLDPLTYFGGTLLEGALKGGSLATNVALKGVGKLLPETEAGLRLAGQGVKDGLGKAFVYGYNTTKGLSNDFLEFTTKVDDAKVGIAASNLGRLGPDILTQGQQEELITKLMAGKRAELATGRATAEGQIAAREAAQSTDPAVQRIIDEQSARSQKFAKQSGIADPFERYFPGIKAESLQKAIRNGPAIGNEAYLKQFKDLLGDDELLKDLPGAFASREFAMVKDRLARDFLEGTISKYGKSLEAFATEEEAAKAGYSVVKEKGIFGKPVGYLKEADKYFLDGQLTPQFTAVSTLAKATGFDAATALWKRYVTGPFAPFHVRNYVSGHIQNFEALGIDALNPANIAAGSKIALKMARGEEFPSQIVKIGKQELDMGKLFSRFTQRFGGDASYVKDIQDISKTGIEGASTIRQSLKDTVKTAGLGTNSIHFRAARALGAFIEHQQKATAYITALSQGKNVGEALDFAAKAGFDYRALTPFESNVMRRLIPFYSFNRKNIELQLSTLAHDPQRINQVFALMNNAGDALGGKPSDEENKYLPQYLKDSLGIKLKDTPQGLAQYIAGFGSPIEAFTDLINGNPVLKGISMVNPILQVPIELGIGKDAFRQKDLKDTYDASEYSGAPQVVKDLLKIVPVERPVLKEGPNGKLIETGQRVQYVADPYRLLIARSLFTSRGFTYLDQMFDGDVHGFAKAVNLTTGVKVRAVDLAQQKGITESEQKRALEDLLKKYGEITTFQDAYIPKNQSARGVLNEGQ